MPKAFLCVEKTVDGMGLVQSSVYGPKAPSASGLLTKRCRGPTSLAAARLGEEVDYQYSALPDDMPEPTATFKVKNMLEPLEGFAEALRMRLDELPETCFTWPDGSHKKKYENLLPIGRTVGDRLPLHFGSTHNS